MRRTLSAIALPAALLLLAAAVARPRSAASPPVRGLGVPIQTTDITPGTRVDALIRPGESHFAGLWQLTDGGQNAEAYWSSTGMDLIFQSTREGHGCDQMYVMDLPSLNVRPVSTGRGRCTCGYFYDHDQHILFSSTHLASDSCPPTPDYSKGYVWRVDPDYDVFTAKPDGSDLRRLTTTPGYDAETTVSTDGRWLVFTSDRDGDLEIYKMHPDGTGLTRLTRAVGYDGGPFFSRDGRWIVYRANHPTEPAAMADYRELLAHDLVRPTRMDIWVMRADGSGQRQVTHDPGASFAPYFTPDGRRIIYASNFEHPTGRNFNLYLVPVRGGTPEPVTRDSTFNAFPMFSPDGRWLVFASNRGARQAHETNLFLARWRP